MSQDYSTESDKIFDAYITLIQKIRERYFLTFIDCDTILQLKFILKIISQYADRSTDLEDLVSYFDEFFTKIYEKSIVGTYESLMVFLRNYKLLQIKKKITQLRLFS